MIHTDIKSEMKKSMLAKDETRTMTLRGLLAAFTNELVSKMRKPLEELNDEEAVAVIRRQVKQRKDSIDQFRKGGREDLVSAEEKELKILESLLPASMPKDEIKKIAEAKKAEMGVADKQKMGMLMGAVMKEVKGKADGNDVKEVVESLF